MKSLQYLSLLIFLFAVSAAAQKPPIKFGDVSLEQVKMTRYDADSSASAVVLADYGESTIDYSSESGFRIEFERIRRVKILTRDGYEWGNFSIALYRDGSTEENLGSLKAVTYNFENNKVIETKMKNDAVFKEEADQNLRYVKIALPNVKEGSVVEITYKVNSPFLFNFLDWDFQSTIPTMWSEYRTRIPEYFGYKKFMQGYLSVTVNETKSEFKSFNFISREKTGIAKTSAVYEKVDYSENYTRLAIKDAPAFRTEPYMTTYRDYIARINFELNSIKLPDQQLKTFNDSWADLNNDFLKSESFGGVIKGSNFLKEHAENAVAGKTDAKDKIAAIYYYVRGLIDWDGQYRKYSDENLKRVIDNKKGSSAEINLMLVSMLQKAGINANPVGYDKLIKVTMFKGSVYNAEGSLIKKAKNIDINDQSSYDGFSLYSDNRLKVLSLEQTTYPYTVEFEYEIEFKFLFQIPDFDVIPGEKAAIQHESYTLAYPAELTPRYKVLNMDQKMIRGKTSGGLESVSWTFENIKPVKFEPLSPSSQEVLPQILAAPTLFEYEGYQGSMDSWDQYGQWMGSLNKGRNVLPEETRQKIVQLTQNLKTREEKTKAIYEYLQNKTRYVSIQLGIGGHQPFEASVVDQTGYGDCKALSNYMVAMLEQAGIKGHYTLIRAGDDAEKMLLDFPSSQFNHVVVFVPNETDTLWLECTSQTNPFGYMGSFTGDRKALAITDTGAKIVRTPVYAAEQNVQSRIADVAVAFSGDANAKVRTDYRGLQYENGNLSAMFGNQFDEQKKWIQKNTRIPNFDINSFSMTNKKDKVPSAIVNIDLSLKRYATVSGKRLFLTPNLMNRFGFVPEKIENRKTKVVRNMAYIDVDTIRYNLPEELYPEFLPEPVKLTNQFGEYQSSFILDQGKLVYVRRVRMNKGEFPPDSYNELIEFFKNVTKADNIKIVFLKKT